MIGRLVRDESGIAMGLAVIVVVIVGVMGAGLLVFVRNDLEAVVQVNQGQEAFEAADAGIRAAERELLSNACPQSYDGQQAGAENPDDSCAGSEESEWPRVTMMDENVETTQEEENFVGKELDFDGKQIDVSIRHLPFHEDEGSCDEDPPPDPLSEPQQHPNCAPDEPEGEDDKREFFKVKALGESDNGDARRKIEAIFHTYDAGVLESYFTPQDIQVRGTAEINGVSLFSLEDIEIQDNASISGEDIAYGDWENPPYNEVLRTDDSGSPVTRAGVGAVGNVTGGGSELGGRDFDSNTSPTLVADPADPQADDEITFPFNPETQIDQRDQARINFFREEAQRQEAETSQNHYVAYSGSGNQSLTEWPSNSSPSTVVFFEFDDNSSASTLTWKVGNNCNDEPVQGTLIVKNGDFKLDQNTTPLSGAVIVRGGIY